MSKLHWFVVFFLSSTFGAAKGDGAREPDSSISLLEGMEVVSLLPEGVLLPYNGDEPDPFAPLMEIMGQVSMLPEGVQLPDGDDEKIKELERLLLQKVDVSPNDPEKVLLEKIGPFFLLRNYYIDTVMRIANEYAVTEIEKAGIDLDIRNPAEYRDAEYVALFYSAEFQNFVNKDLLHKIHSLDLLKI